MNDICEISDLPTGQCGHCRLTEPHQREPDSRPFEARYHGTCAGCGFDVRPGEFIQYQPSTVGGSFIAHVRCAHGA